VKTALFGRDANWGRILAAAGRAGVAFDPAQAALWLGTPTSPEALHLLQAGAPLPFDEAQALALLSEHDLTIRLVVGGGGGHATVWTCDFSFDYVGINAEYRT
jgi:glutamate N-acetyltransferase/amino-acid N-acetyltransferase